MITLTTHELFKRGWAKEQINHYLKPVHSNYRNQWRNKTQYFDLEDVEKAEKDQDFIGVKASTPWFQQMINNWDFGLFKRGQPEVKELTKLAYNDYGRLNNVIGFGKDDELHIIRAYIRHHFTSWATFNKHLKEQKIFPLPQDDYIRVKARVNSLIDNWLKINRPDLFR